MYRLNFIKNIENQKGEYKVQVGKQEPEFFDFIQSLISYNIIRPKESFYGFYPDGYIKELNLIIEFDEKFHNHQFQMDHDKIKNQTYLKYKHNILRISEDTWQSNKEELKNNIIKNLTIINKNTSKLITI